MQEMVVMTEKVWELVPYDCQDGKCLMLWNVELDSKLGALSLDHRDIGEGIVEELNKLENFNKDIKIYVETVEEVNEQLRDMRNNLEKKIHIYETTLKEAIQNERTHLGHNALKQLAENLEIL